MNLIDDMKRFLLFGGVYYYPSAGLRDYIGSYFTEQEAREKYHELAAGSSLEWCLLAFIEYDGTLVPVEWLNPLPIR